MKTFHLLAIAGIITVGVLAATSAAAAQGGRKEARNTPPEWSYELRNKQRVPRVPRKVNPDGSWVEDYKAGNCRVSRTGKPKEVREVRDCN
jgi:hypothetical protein